MAEQHSGSADFKPQHDPRLGIPGVVEIDDHIPIKRNLETLFGRIFHKDGTLNREDPRINGVMELADEQDLDVILKPEKDGTKIVFGKWLADHKDLLEIGAIAAAGGVTLITAGLILRKHHRESKEKK